MNIADEQLLLQTSSQSFQIQRKKASTTSSPKCPPYSQQSTNSKISSQPNLKPVKEETPQTLTSLVSLSLLITDCRHGIVECNDDAQKTGFSSNIQRVIRRMYKTNWNFTDT